jgi:NADPH-dependent glutamate synthase beta subunit-like oxidoreductase
MPTVEEAETAFAELLKAYENQWITFIERDGMRVVVGCGRTAVDAVANADANGFPDAILFKVPSLTSSFVPSVSTPPAH